MTADSLKDRNKKSLARMAKDQGVIGWHAMRKDQLIRALCSDAGASKKDVGARDETALKSKVVKPAPPKAKPVAPPKSNARASAPHFEQVDRASSNGGRAITVVPPRPLDHGCVKDRVIVMVRDPYWLHAYWELSRSTLSRAQAALGQEWHAAKPILRLMDVSSEDTTSSSERHVRDVEIHGGVNNWYIDVNNPPKSYRVDIGYLSRRGKFFVLARSNVVSTPKAGVADMLDQSWMSVQEQFAKIYQQTPGTNGANISNDLKDLFEERLRRPMHGPSLTGFSPGLAGLSSRDFHFELDAELIVYGATEPNAKVTLQGEPIQLRPDGTFTVRFSLPDSRQIIPAVAASHDGVEERTIVLAVERNTKELEPMIHDGNDL